MWESLSFSKSLSKYFYLLKRKIVFHYLNPQSSFLDLKFIGSSQNFPNTKNELSISIIFIIFQSSGNPFELPRLPKYNLTWELIILDLILNFDNFCVIIIDNSKNKVSLKRPENKKDTPGPQILPSTLPPQSSWPTSHVQQGNYSHSFI